MINLTRAMTESIQKKYPLNESQEILKKSGDLVLEKTVEFDGTCYSVYKDWRTDPDGFGYGVHLDTFRTLEDAEDYFEKVKKGIKESLLKESKNKVFSDTQDGEFGGIVNELTNLDKNISSKIDCT